MDAMKPSTLFIGLSALLCAVASAAPQVVVPRVSTPPVIDGKLDDAAWASAAQVAAFTVAGQGVMASHPAATLLAYDDRALYLGFRILIRCSPQAQQRARDGQVWSDDAVEFLLDPGRTGTTFYHFIINAAGSIYDAKGSDASFNAELSTATGEHGDWIVEVALPFASLGAAAPKVGESWGGTFCLDAQTPTPEVSSWADTGGRFETPEKFGQIVFGGTTAAQLQPLVPPSHASWKVAVTAVSQQPAEVVVKASVLAGKTVVADLDQHLSPTAGQPAEADLFATLAFTGRHLLRVTATAGQQVLYSQEVAFDQGGAVQLQARDYALGDSVNLVLTLSPEVLSKPEVEVEFSVTGAVGRIAGVPERVKPLSGQVCMKVPLRTPGDYTAEARLLSEGKAFGDALTNFTVLPRQDYYFSGAGASDAVLPPFTALKSDRSRFECWGRTYDFGRGPLPRTIKTRGEQVLAGPVRLVGVSDAKSMAWRVGHGTLLNPSQTGATWLCNANAGNLKLMTDTTVEYDGCITTRLRLGAPEGQTVDRLALEIPLNEKNARYIHAARADWAGSYSSGVGEAGWKWEKPFYPYVWLGDEERGLAWFSETDEPFQLNDPAKAIQVEHLANGQVALRINLIDHPVQLAETLHWAFGLQATPVKPVPRRLPHLYHGAYYGMESKPYVVNQSLTYPAPGNIDMRQGTLETVVTVDFDPAESLANKQNYGLFNLKHTNGNMVCWFWDYQGQGMWFYVGIGAGYPQTYPVHITANNLGWKKGETHHLALTWSDKTRMYVDGKLAAESAPHEGWLTDDLAGTLLQFGSVGSDPSGFTLHELRLAKDVASPEQLAATAAQLQAQGSKLALPDTPDTLLLDHFAGLTANGQPQPAAKLSAAGSLRGGTLARPGSMAEGGLALGGNSQKMTYLDYLKSKGVEVVVYHDTWTDQYGIPTTPFGDEMRSLVKGCHDRGMKLIIYFGYGLAGTTEQMKTYHDQWTVRPLIPWSGGKPERTFDAGCNRSPLMEFMCDGIEKLARDFDIDGIYMDGTTECFACVNGSHGCGYERDGKMRPTHSIWRNREFMRRLYTIFRQQRKEPILDQHMSGNLIIPELSFCDSYWDGEQFEGYKFGEQKALELLPLDKFRAEFMGKQWGLRAEFLNYEKRPFTMRESLSFVLLHDMYVRASGGGDHLDQVSAIWKACDDFGTDQAQWLPYWDQQVARPSPAGVYCSAYVRPGKGALLVVSNLTGKPLAAQVRLDRKGLQLGSGAVSAREARTGQEIGLADNVLTVDLDSMDYALVRIGPR